MRPAGAAGQPQNREPAQAKAEMRARLNAARAARAPDPAADIARTVRCLAAAAGAAVVASYTSRPGEPETRHLIETLYDADVRVLLPVPDPRPSWAWYTGRDRLIAGTHGIQQPDGPTLGPAALAEADVIFVPGLAGTPDGRRLGTGGGWYDRALAWARPGVIRGLLLFDDEVLADVPTERWDLRVDLLVTERARIDCARE